MWEVTYFGENGREIRREKRYLGPAELMQWPEIAELMKKAISALAPRRRLDSATLLPPMEMLKLRKE